RAERRVDRWPRYGQIGALMTVAKAEGPGTETSPLRPGGLRAVPMVERILSLERCGQLELLFDDGRNRVCRRQRQRLAQTSIQKRNLFVLAIEIGLQRFHLGSDVLSWKTLFSPSRSR